MGTYLYSMKKLYIMFLFLLGIAVSFNQGSHIELENLKKDYITVEIKGEVEKPGVYLLDKGTTINDVIYYSDLTDKSDISNLNLTTVLKDHDVVVIDEVKEKRKISINTASLEELVTLNGIGETIANRIIEYRNNNGPFQRIEDLMNVKGIGKKKLEKIREDISL